MGRREGVISMPDGSMLFTEQDADRILKVDRNNNISTYVENTNRTIGLACDGKGRLIGTQSRDPKVVYLPERERCSSTLSRGNHLLHPNDLVIDRKGGIYFTDPLGNPQQRFRDRQRGGSRCSFTSGRTAR